MKYFECELEDLARDMAKVAASADEAAMSRRLMEMAGEVLALADREAAGSSVYHSAIFFLHTGGSTNSPEPYAEPYADDHSSLPAQRN